MILLPNLMFRGVFFIMWSISSSKTKFTYALKLIFYLKDNAKFW